MKLLNAKRNKSRLEHRDRRAILCDPACIAEGERDRMSQNLFRYGFWSL